ncbi:ATP-dependent RecD-like DNA helicase [Klenkia sp. PcliD-1-E]|uniref:ATP-dependent DNA helicase n=1 Tax=Klenkia sp. PcliD-1-E TaxID=2954492 RepID=UPI0020969F0F|nr:AAA family ATPase [Klenkia sp. PcliD-1-E]MCO7221709.1 AAA family ATPase [Klenkia sp. PcliD-1-E]
MVLAAEHDVLEAAGRFDGHVTPPSAVADALEPADHGGPALNTGQADFVRELATSGARVQVALAPAGTGKTTALGVLAAAWRAGGGTVVGLAPSAAATSVLREQLTGSTDTVAKFVHAAQTGVDVPASLSTLGPRSLVVVDEAGATSTQDLGCVVTTVLAAGGSIRLVGDDQQLGPVGAGGLLRDLVAAHGAARLDEVVRFVHPDTGARNHLEGAASLALREGDSTALGYYADRGRLHVGDLSSCVDQAFTAWAADRALGRDALMLAPTRDLVRQLNLRARADRLTREAPGRRGIDLADGTTASAGDVVITRRNDRTLAHGTHGWVTNGDRWTVADVRPSGAVDVVNTGTAALVTLPPDYVRSHLVLGYATTVHGAQGVTADTSYVVVAGTESRQQLYVALTRGRHTNHAFVAVTGDGDPHIVLTRDGVLPRTAVEVLQRILARDEAPTSATRIAANQHDPALQLTTEVGRYVHSLTTAAEEQIGTDGVAGIDRAAAATAPGLTDEPAYPALRANLVLHAASGYDPAQLLQVAADDPRGLDSARDAAAVLDWRIGCPAPDQPAPLTWLPAVPRPLTDNPVWGSYLARRAERVQDLAQAVGDVAAEWNAMTTPAWARPLSADPDLVRDLAVWRAAVGVEPSDLRPSGAPSAIAATDAEHQGRLDDRVRRCMGSTTADARGWATRLSDLAPAITADPWLPVLIDRLLEHRLDDPARASVVAAATARPLPDELPAAALWWRLAEQLPVRTPGGEPGAENRNLPAVAHPAPTLAGPVVLDAAYSAARPGRRHPEPPPATGRTVPAAQHHGRRLSAERTPARTAPRR